MQSNGSSLSGNSRLCCFQVTSDLTSGLTVQRSAAGSSSKNVVPLGWLDQANGPGVVAAGAGGVQDRAAQVGSQERDPPAGEAAASWPGP